MDYKHEKKRKTTAWQVMEYISSQHIKCSCNKIHIITAWRENNILRTNLQENQYIFYQIIQIQAMGEKTDYPRKKSSNTI